MKAVKAVAFVLLLITASAAFAHEHKAGETDEQSRVVEFLRTWKRPKGHYSIPHRIMSCCYISGLQQDCFAVKEVRVRDGQTYVFPDVEGHMEYARWYVVPEGISEAEQPDGRDSPDGRSYVCIAGAQVICFQPGAGM